MKSRFEVGHMVSLYHCYRGAEEWKYHGEDRVAKLADGWLVLDSGLELGLDGSDLRYKQMKGAFGIFHARRRGEGPPRSTVRKKKEKR